MSKSLFVKKVNNQDLALEYRVLQHTFASVDVHAIDNAPWHEQYPYKPQVTFKMVHSVDSLGICYTVHEEFVKANAIRANERVFEDSCVEFFFSLDNKKTYYNFEFNVLGTGLIGYGPAVKAERNRLSAEIIDAVDTMTIVTKQDGLKSWEIFLIIPKSILTKNNKDESWSDTNQAEVLTRKIAHIIWNHFEPQDKFDPYPKIN